MILRDEQWEKLEALLLEGEGDPDLQRCDNRSFIEAVFWYVDALRWRNLPPEFGKWITVYVRFRRWNQSGVWRRLKEKVKGDPELEAQFEKIVACTHNARSRAKKKADIKSVPRAYSWPIWRHDGEETPHGGQVDADADWLRLAMGAIRQRINSK